MPSRTIHGANGGMGRTVAGDRGAPPARRAEPVESGQGPVMGATATRAGGAGGIRSHAGHAIPAHGAVSAVAVGQGAGGLHLRAIGGGSATRNDGDLLADRLKETRRM